MNKVTLLVDDDPVVNFVHKRMIQKYCPFGEPTVFEDGTPALEFLKQHHQNYDLMLVLLDINMPEMNGWEFLDKVSQYDWDKKLIIFMLTSSIAQEDMDRAKEYKLIKGYLPKPLNKEKCMQIRQEPLVKELL